jgi:hypothetical protein
MEMYSLRRVWMEGTEKASMCARLRRTELTDCGWSLRRWSVFCSIVKEGEQKEGEIVTEARPGRAHKYK